MNHWEVSSNQSTIAESTVADSFVRYRFQSGRPELGLNAGLVENNFQMGTFFGLPQLRDDSPRRYEHFARQNQLTEWYSETKSQSIETLIILRHCPEYNGTPKFVGNANVVSSMEMILSIQTSLLDAKPIDEVEFELPWLNPNEISCFLTQLAVGESLSQGREPNGAEFENEIGAGILAVHSSDLKKLNTVAGKSGSRLVAKLRCQNLEKGVIRRFRLFVAFVPLGHRQLLQEMANAFEASQLPLST